MIASKMLYASHYFWTAFELGVLLPDPSRGPGFWFVTISRSRSDGLSGFIGRLIRGPGRGEAEKGTLAVSIAHAPKRSRLGLFHFAILLPDRPSLGRFVRHLADIGAAAGAADHLVSESLYLQDPDNLGIEVYADRPRSTWRRVGRQLDGY